MTLGVAEPIAGRVDARSDAPPRSPTWLQRGVLAVPLVVLAAAGWAHRLTVDDGFIYFRVVRQIRLGHGPVYNVGQRVEAFTGPLWVAILSIADLLTPIRLEWIAVVLGIGLSVLGAALAMGGAARLARRDHEHALLVPVGIAVFVAVLPVWYFETSGLENGLVFGWLGACTWTLADWATRRRHLSAVGSIVIGLGWLVRPELVVYSAVFVLVVAAAEWRTRTWPQRLASYAWMLALPVAYQLFRMGYYGVAVSNTAIAKEGSKLRTDVGWSYLQDFTRPYWLWVPAALLLLGLYLPAIVRAQHRHDRRTIIVLAAFLAGAALNTTAVVAFGGDYFHGRLLLPALFALCAPVAVATATRDNAAGLAIIGWALICALTLRPPETRNPNGFAFRGAIGFRLPVKSAGDVTLADVGWVDASPRTARLRTGAVSVIKTGLGAQPITRVDVPAPRDLHVPTVVSGLIGAMGYAAGPNVDVLDINGLADPLTAHLALAQRGEPGHEKVLPTPWVAARVTRTGTNPSADLIPLENSATTPPAANVPFEQQVAFARAALRCEPVADLARSTERPLTVRRFFSNVVHALSRTQRRVPSDPRQAQQRFCSDEAPRAAAAARDDTTTDRHRSEVVLALCAAPNVPRQHPAVSPPRLRGLLAGAVDRAELCAWRPP